MVERRRQDIIFFGASNALRSHVRALLEHDGFAIAEAEDATRLRDQLKGGSAFGVMVSPGMKSSDVDRLRADLARAHPGVNVLAPPSGYGHAVVQGSLARERTAHFALDSLFLLANLVERATDAPPRAERMAQMAELTCRHLGLALGTVEAAGAAAVLACLGKALGQFRFGKTPKTTADGGLTPELQSALAAAATLRSPYDLAAVLEATDERWDGRGRPKGLAGAAIPIAARVVGVVRDFAAFSEIDKEESKALLRLTGRAGTDYDPAVVDAFCRALRETDYVQRIGAKSGGLKIAVADGDASSLAVAELQLAAAGFAVSSYQDGRTAQDAILAAPPDAVVADLGLPRVDGLSLLVKLRREPATEKVPVFLVGGANAALATKALKLGAADVMAKPVPFEVLVAKIRALARRTATAAAAPGSPGSSGAELGVFGTLAEIGLTDLVQVVSFGRRSVTITIKGSRGEGSVVVERGDPLAAFTKTLSGIDAFCEIATWTDGRFRMETGSSTVEPNLNGSLESLLLEALRRTDEARRP